MVYHILKDGRQVKDIKGLVVKQKDNVILYDVIRKIEARGRVINKTK